MPRVRCITMQKDEGSLIDAWLRYHGYLFGFENLEVIDNASTDPTTLDTLEGFEATGVTIHRQHTTVECFEGKGGIIAGIIAGWDESLDYDFALPCDSDEFLALFTPGGLCCGRQTIHAALEPLADQRQALGIATSLFNVPAQPGWFRPELFPKGFLRARSIASLDSGFHVPQSRHAEGSFQTDFTYLHYHNKPYDVLRAHTRRKLYRRVDIDDPEAIRAYAGAGSHMTKNLLMSPEQYVRQHDDLITLRFEGFPNLMRALGVRDPVIVGETLLPPAPAGGRPLIRLPRGGGADGAASRLLSFDAAGYLEDHPDVAASGDFGLPHFLYHGYTEDRVVRREADAELAFLPRDEPAKPLPP